jgi:hypothetical protein
VVVIGLTAGVYLLWRAEENRKGTLTLDCPEDSFAVEICADRPLTKWELLTGSDARPEFWSWGQGSPEMRSRRCVWFREVERRAVDIKLPPGRYILGAHRKSPCGHYGGDTFKTVEIGEGGAVVVTIAH